MRKEAAPALVLVVEGVTPARKHVSREELEGLRRTSHIS